MYPSSVLISSSSTFRRCNDLSIAARSAKEWLSKKLLSSDTRGAVMEALLLRSVTEKPCERAVVFRDRATALTLARLALALRTAETKANEDPEDDCR